MKTITITPELQAIASTAHGRELLRAAINKHPELQALFAQEDAHAKRPRQHRQLPKKPAQFKEVLATAYGADVWLPVLTGQQTPQEWMASLKGKVVLTRNGYQISAVRDALFKSQMAMTNIALALRAATELGVVPYTMAIHEGNKVYDLFTTFASHFAANRDEGHRELVAAEVSFKVKDGCFDELVPGHSKAADEDELLSAGYSWEQIEEVMDMREAESAAHHSGERHQGMSEDEGMLRTAIHDISQLWQVELTDIEWAEAFTAKVALVGKMWPADHPMWEDFLDRVAQAWQASIDNIQGKNKRETRELTVAAEKKISKRAAVLEYLHVKPMYARWAVNHVTRRLWRDLESLRRKVITYEGKLEVLDRNAMIESRHGVPTGYTRPNLGESNTQVRVEFLPFGTLEESEVGKAELNGEVGIHLHEDGIEVRGTYEIQEYTAKHEKGNVRRNLTVSDLAHSTQEEKDRAWFNAVIEECELQTTRMEPLYQRLRDLDNSLSRLWELFNDNGRMPAQPPIYWDMKGYYLTEEEARAAVDRQVAEYKAKMRVADDDAGAAAAEAMAALLNNM